MNPVFANLLRWTELHPSRDPRAVAARKFVFNGHADSALHRAGVLAFINLDCKPIVREQLERNPLNSVALLRLSELHALSAAVLEAPIRPPRMGAIQCS